MKTETALPMKKSRGSRVELVDALRGSALMGILLLHSIEHWEYSRNPEHASAWLAMLNRFAFEGGFFLFGGKSYAVFALMFGVSFSFLFESWSREGRGFASRFLWRLGILAVFGYANGLVYCGDFLLVIAILGLPLVFLNRFGNRVLAWVGILLVLQIPTLIQVGRVAFSSSFEMARPYHWGVYGQLWPVFGGSSLWEVIKINAGLGQLARLTWTYETGRYTQMMGLFVFGLLLARSGVLWDEARRVRFATRALVLGVVGFAVLYPAGRYVGEWRTAGMSHYVLNSLVTSYTNLAQLAIWVGGFILVYQWARGRTVLRVLAPFGRMSLSNYVMQGMIGVPLFYGFGFALYRWLGSFYSVGLGIGILGGQIAFSHFWLKRFNYGPLEWLWRSLTFWNFTLTMRKATTALVRENQPVTVY